MVQVTGGWGGLNAQVSREGNKITVDDANHRNCRCPGDLGYQIDIEGDSLHVAGFREHDQVEFTVTMSPDQIVVETPDRGFRSRRGGGNDGPAISSITLDTPLQKEQYEQVGLGVVSSLIGIPLVFPAG